MILVAEGKTTIIGTSKEIAVDLGCAIEGVATSLLKSGFTPDFVAQLVSNAAVEATTNAVTRCEEK